MRSCLIGFTFVMSNPPIACYNVWRLKAVHFCVLMPLFGTAFGLFRGGKFLLITAGVPGVPIENHGTSIGRLTILVN